MARHRPATPQDIGDGEDRLVDAEGELIDAFWEEA